MLLLLKFHLGVGGWGGGGAGHSDQKLKIGRKNVKTQKRYQKDFLFNYNLSKSLFKSLQLTFA